VTVFSAKAEYACLAMLELAARFGDPKPIRLADVADAHGIPQRFLVQILLQLKGAGLVASTRGAAGGYQLARPPEEITLADVLGVIDRADPATAANAPGRTDPTPLAGALRGVWGQIQASKQKLLESTTLAGLVEAGRESLYVI
jgi:Rrf2 family transcriptional regulator, cysteine metabolism repressor